MVMHVVNDCNNDVMASLKGPHLEAFTLVWLLSSLWFYLSTFLKNGDTGDRQGPVFLAILDGH